MDPYALVDFEIEAGRRLVFQLVGDGFDVKAAFWARLSEERNAFLYIASPLVEEKGLLAAYGNLQASLQRLEGMPLTIGEVKVIGENSEMARDAGAILRRHPGRIPTRIADRRLGGETIGIGYVYESSLLEAPARGSMTQEQLFGELFRILSRGPGSYPPSRVTLRDGSTFEGAPFSIQSDSQRPPIVQFIAENEFAPRVLSIDEIASIQ